MRLANRGGLWRCKRTLSVEEFRTEAGGPFCQIVFHHKNGVNWGGFTNIGVRRGWGLLRAQRTVETYENVPDKVLRNGHKGEEDRWWECHGRGEGKRIEGEKGKESFTNALKK